MGEESRKDIQALQQKIRELQAKLARTEKSRQYESHCPSGRTEPICQTIGEIINDAALTVSFNGTVLFCNAQLCRLLKLARNQIIGHSLREFVTDYEPMESLLISATTRPTEKRIYFKTGEGTELPAQVLADVLHLQDRKSICLIARDLSNCEESEKLVLEFQRQREALQLANEDLVTTEEELRIQNDDLVRSQKELDAARARYQHLFETVPDGYIVTTPDGFIEENNPKAAFLCGQPNPDLKGKSISVLLPDPEIARIISDLKAGIESVSKREIKICNPEGRSFWADITTAVSHDKSGKTTGLCWLIRDISDRKNAEEALTQSEERWRLLFEYAPAALAMFDRQMKYLAVSNRWLRDYHLTGQNLIGRSHYEVFRIFRSVGTTYTSVAWPVRLCIRRRTRSYARMVPYSGCSGRSDLGMMLRDRSAGSSCSL